MTTEPVPPNLMLALLKSLGVVDEARLELYAPGTRDCPDLPVLRDRASGVIFLSRVHRSDLDYYEAKTATRAEVALADRVIATPVLDDAKRRAQMFGAQIAGKAWLDFGTGAAAMLDLLGRDARRAVGIEPQATDRNAALARGLDVRRSLADVQGEAFDVVTLFHVLEHLPDPIETLQTLRALLAPGGILIVEVPHARDFLLQTLDSAAFRAFTLWSEHLVLHTRDSLERLLVAAGLRCRSVSGYQRYPLSNHLYWLRHERPGGHNAWSFLNTPTLEEVYASTLADLDQTDTLLAIASGQ